MHDRKTAGENESISASVHRSPFYRSTKMSDGEREREREEKIREHKHERQKNRKENNID